MTQKLIIMTEEEILRYDIIRKLLDKKLKNSQAAKLLDLSVRQIKRLKKKVREKGAEGLIHKNRGKESNRKIKEETLRQIMIEKKLWNPKPRKETAEYHSWRERKECFGEMEQFDGSYHKWLEDRAGEMCLLLSIDDANGKITHAKFDENEGVVAVFKFWLEYFGKNGLPMSIYLDKFSTYKINHPSAVDNKELRLAGISTIEEANEFLKEYIPKFNKRFSAAPRSNNNLHKMLSQELKEKLPQIFSIQSPRKVNNDYTIMFKTRFFQLAEIQPRAVYKKDTVIIEEHLGGEIKIGFKRHYLNYQELPERPKKQKILLPALTRTKSSWKPPADHPWRKQFLVNKFKEAQAVFKS